jgi:arabinofuranosyltransferase
MTMETQKEPGNRNAPTIPAASKIVRRYPSLSLLILGLPILLAFVSIAMQNWNVVFDDAFISYRYAQNLAMGHGITWNPGYPPTEGYTNFLLVLILAPAIWIGLDPLLVTRVLSFICAIGMAGIIFAVARRQYSCSPTVAIMIAALIFLVPATVILCLVGLETVIYAFFLLITFMAGVRFVDRKQLSHSILFSCLLFATMLLRPEAALLYPIISIAFVVVAVRNKDSLKPLMAGLLAILASGGAYLTWKYFHFGQLLPNPFYLKASGQAFISPDGLQSVMSFASEYALLLFLAFLGLLLALVADKHGQLRNKIVASTGFAFVVVYCLFFAHVDTLMNVYGRFLYPLFPLVILLAIPTLAKVLGYFDSVSARKYFALPVLMVGFLLAFAPTDVSRLPDRLKWLTSNHQSHASESYMEKELRISKALAHFSRIREVRIAFADAGVMPYFSGAIWLDVVGLNDGFIARAREQNKLIDYFFDWSPDLVIHPGKAGLSWFRDGHGPLGDYLSWSNDPRWDEYVYVGTSRMPDISYDLQYFVRKSSRFRGPLEGFLKANVVDGWYDPFPIPIGTYYPKGIQPTWWSR